MFLPMMLIAIVVYLVYYTFTYARRIWQDGNKLGASAVAVMAVSFIPIGYYVQLNI